MLRRDTAAKYCDLTPSKFIAEVSAGRLPQPVKLGGEDHWCRAAMDNDLDRIAGLTSDWRKEQPGLAA